jgi:uncharacterized membrane protein YciS (DUF1049 family)
MFHDKRAKLATSMFVIVAILLPMLGLLIMNDQLTKANYITGSVTVEPASGANQTFAGVLVIGLVVVGLLGILFTFRNKRPPIHEVNAKIDNLSEQIKKL